MFAGYAVVGFFIISGYLMTLVMHKTYGYTLQGSINFILNRMLRLLPMYWLAVILTIILIFWIGADAVKNYHLAMQIPSTFEGWLSNITMLFWSWDLEISNRAIIYSSVAVVPRLVPPAWALTTEIIFYALICFGVSKNLFRVWLWLAVSICYYIATFFVGSTWWLRYYPALAASLPFCIGSLIYFLKEKYTPKLNPLLLFVLILLNAAYHPNYDLGAIVNMVLVALLILSIANGYKFPFITSKIDKIIGDFSYPIYLLHWQVGLMVSYVVIGHPARHEIVVYFVSLAVILVLSVLMIEVIDKPIQKVRTIIKSSS